MEERDGAEERLGGEDGHCGGFDEVLCAQLVSLVVERKSRGRGEAEVRPLCGGFLYSPDDFSFTLNCHLFVA